MFGRARIGRLALQSGVAFALLTASAGVAMYFVAKRQLVADVDRSLDRERQRLGMAAPLPELTRTIARLEQSRAVTDKGHALFDQHGRLLFGRIVLALPPDGYSDVSFRETQNPRRRYARALVTPLPGGERLVILSHSEIVEDLDAVLLPLSLALLLTAIAGGLLATHVLGRQIATRLRETMTAADAISAGDLSRRVPTARLDGVFRAQAESLNRMLDRMEGLIDGQRQFSRHLAHDLRTPLTRLRGILRESEGQPLPAGMTRIFERAERECVSTIRIFDALMRLSEVEAGRHPAALRPVALRDLIEDIVETMEPVLADAGGSLRTGTMIDATVTADRDLIEQLFVNLLENVALHTPPGTNAVISLRLDAQGVLVSVADDGPGLAAEQRRIVLQPFERGHGSNAVKGTGLGLAIAQAIVRFHGGALLLADNAPGLAVEIRLPGGAA